MKHQILALLLAVTTVSPIAIADTSETPKKTGHSRDFWVARRAALVARKEAQRERVRQFKADREANEEKLYQDWHERYVADAPVREAYYRNEEAQAAAAQPQTIVYVNQAVGQSNSPAGYTGYTGYTPSISCTMTRRDFINANYNYTFQGAMPGLVPLPTLQP